MDELYIGLMSGTSIDGVDAVLVDFTNGFHCLQTLYEPYPPGLREQLSALVQAQSCRFADLLDADNEVAVVHALAVKKLLANAQHNPNRIGAIGFHGQTLFHHPDAEHGNTLQIGNPSFLAEHTGITTVSDFRRRDMAAGGQGAPFAPAFHEFLFRKQSVTRCIVNIGGIANITVLPGDPSQKIMGFDTGPGNCLLDDWYARYHDGQFDDQGAWAASGTPDPGALATLLADPYFSRPTPKSTGREYFHLDWLTQQIESTALNPQDMQATLLQLTAQTIARGIRQAAPATREVYVCGGGVHNAALFSALQQQLDSMDVATTATLGLDPDWVEAAAFAWFAQQTMHAKALKLQSITGARNNCIAGAIYQ